MKIERKTLIKSIKIAILICAVYCFYKCNSMLQDFSPDHWSDEELIDHFNENQPDFEKLRVLMLEENSLISITDDKVFVENDVKLSDDKINQLRSYLEKLQLIEGGIYTGSKEVGFTVTSGGFVTHNSEKGYIYSNEEDLRIEIMSSLDVITKELKGDGARRITNNWYIYFSGY